MDTKQLVDKFIKGEINETEFETEKAKLTDEEKVALEEEAKKQTPSAVEKLIGIRRGMEKISDKKDTDMTNKLKEENLVAAKNKFFTDFGIEKDEDKVAFESGFKTDSINVENIIKDMKTHYVAKNPDHYLNLEREKRNREKEAEEFTASGAGGGNGNGGGENLKKVSKEAQEYIQNTFKMFGKVVSPEQAERALRIKEQGGHIPTA